MHLEFNLSVTDIKSDFFKQFDPNLDSIYVCGSLKQLGEWNILKSIGLNHVDSNKWQATVNNVNDQLVEYRYYVARKGSNGNVFLRQVESKTRTVNLPINNDIKAQLNDVWRLTGQDKTAPLDPVYDGWLLNNQIELQLCFSNKPITFYDNNFNKQSNDLTISVEAYQIDSSNSQTITTIQDFITSFNEFSENEILIDPPVFKSLSSSDYYGIFHFRTHFEPSKLILKIFVGTIGFGYLKLPKNVLDFSSSLVDVPLYHSITNVPIGNLTIDLLLLRGPNRSDVYYLKDVYKYDYGCPCKPTGHRGCGKTFDADALEKISYVENTIESFDQAFKNGAQMVEFDVVLSKDEVPLIYHDFSACLRSENNPNKYIDIGIHQLTYEEIKHNKLYAHKIVKKLPPNGDNSNFISDKMYPKLSELFDQLDERLGFDIEIKYPQELEDGTNEADRSVAWIDRNNYVDIILKELMNNCKNVNRCVIITTFDPIVAEMFKLKQNRYPVLFITNGITNKWVPYFDFRTKNTRISTNFALTENMNGVVLHAEELVKDKSLIESTINIKKRLFNFLVEAWGDDLNISENRVYFKQSGFDAIIYDRIKED